MAQFYFGAGHGRRRDKGMSRTPSQQVGQREVAQVVAVSEDPQVRRNRKRALKLLERGGGICRALAH